MSRSRRILRKRLHQTPPVLLDLFNPVRLPCANQDMGAEFLDMAVQRLHGVNLDSGWKCRGAISAISSTVGPILFGGNCWEDVFGGLRACAQGQPRAKHPNLCNVRLSVQVV